MPIVGVVVLAAATAGLAAVTVLVGVAEKPSKGTVALLQVMTLLFGVLTSYVYSRISARAAALEIIRPHARAAIRRMVNLHEALGRQTEALTVHFEQLEQSSRDDASGEAVVELTAVKWSMVGLQQLVTEQRATAADSIEDWRDIVPDEVSKILSKDSEAANG